MKDRGAWHTAVLRVARSQTWLSDSTVTTEKERKARVDCSIWNQGCCPKFRVLRLTKMHVYRRRVPTCHATAVHVRVVPLFSLGRGHRRKTGTGRKERVCCVQSYGEWILEHELPFLEVTSIPPRQSEKSGCEIKPNNPWLQIPSV